MTEHHQKLYSELYLRSYDMCSKGFARDDQEKELLKFSEDIVLITVVITEAKKDYHEVCRRQGQKYLTAGCVLCLVGFLITFLNFNTSRSINFAMYGLTSLGIGFVFLGLYKILG